MSTTHIKYTEDHEWLKIDGDVATVGITVHAQDALGDVVFVDLPEVGALFAQKETAGVVESVKAAADVYMPVGGEVLEVNEHNVAQSVLRMHGDADGGNVAVNLQPFVVFGVFSGHRELQF